MARLAHILVPQLVRRDSIRDEEDDLKKEKFNDMMKESHHEKKEHTVQKDSRNQIHPVANATLVAPISCNTPRNETNRGLNKDQLPGLRESKSLAPDGWEGGGFEESSEEEEDEGDEDGEELEKGAPSSGAVISSTFNTGNDMSYQILEGTKYMVRINDPKRIKWDLFVMACATWNCISVPLAISLIPNAFDVTGLVVMDFIIDFLFLCDIIINFRTTFINSKGEEIADPKIIAKHYMKFSFWIDFLSCFPFDYVARLFTDRNTKFFDILGLLKLVRIARLTKVINFLNVTESVKMTLKLLKIIFFLLLYLHTLGCSWWLVVSSTEDYIPPTDYMYVETDVFEQTLSYKYFISVYMALAMLNGGECGPATTEQLLFACAFILIGAMITANIFGEMAVIVAALNRKEAKFQQKLDLANTSMKNMSLPKEIQRKVINYIFYTQSSKDQQTELNSFLKLISPSLKMEVIRHMFGGVLRINSIFKNQSHGVIDFIIGGLESVAFLPEDEIINQGDTADKLYFVCKGDAEVNIQDHISNKPHVIKVLFKGELFGEIALLNEGKRTANVKALNYCNTAALSLEHFKQIRTEFPNIIDNFKVQARAYSDPVKSFIKKSLMFLDIFTGCNEDTLNEVILNMKVEEYNDKTVIQKRHKTSTDIIVIARGQIALHIDMAEGKEEMVDVLGPGSIFNLYGSLTETPCKVKATSVGFTSVFLLCSRQLKELANVDESVKEGLNYISKKWEIQTPICNYIINIPEKRSTKEIFSDCLRRRNIIRKKQAEVGNKFAHLLEHVKRQQLEEKRIANLVYLEDGPDTVNRRTSLLASNSMEWGSTEGVAVPSQISTFQISVDGEINNLDREIAMVKNSLMALAKDLKK